ncbi:hypothetical protein N0V82_008384 [Gnomoniopsis sp. IMI 355080]|nr:hypothetical protein N0V82_008384 [Gnomoniopsis sp. IMI 355080]
MTITALSEDTVRLLGSHTVITTPVDLVKELLDNAIDAKASSVDILVSPNIVDKVEVRDNGQGIRPDDYTALGRAGHTSKITSFEDLRTLGGTTLGFRGQALASANNLGTVTVTTRTFEDPTAMELNMSPGVGGVKSQRRTSAPIGTTVSVVGLYNLLPVRKQAAVKDCLKNLVKIKQMLHAYALARPQIRLSFRVLGGSNRQTFSYSPRPGVDVHEALVQIFGIEITSQCLIRTICSGAGNKDDQTTEDGGRFSIEAVLPKTDADQSRIAKGPFFSVDSRPVSAQRETMKKLLAVFKSRFSEALQSIYGERAFRDSFLCVNIICPPGSYDPNIEPSKNVVLFSDESEVIRLFERLCADLYSIPESHDPFTTLEKRQFLQIPQTRTPPTSSDSPTSEELIRNVLEDVPQDLVSLSKQTPLSSSSSPIRKYSGKSVPQRRPVPAKTARQGFAFDMSADPDASSDEEAGLLVPPFRQQDECQAEEPEEDPMEALNPWTIARMNAPARETVITHPPLAEQTQYAGQIPEHSNIALPDELFENLPVLRPFGDAPADLNSPRTTRLGNMPMIYQKDGLPGFQHPLNHSIMTCTATRETLQPFLQTSELNSRQTLPTLRSSKEMQAAGRLSGEEVGESNLDNLVQTRLDFGSHTRDSQRTLRAQKQRHINDIPSKTNPPFRKSKRVNIKNRQPASSNQGHIEKNVADWIDNHQLTGRGLGSMRPQRTPRFSASPPPCFGTTDASETQGSLPPSVPRHDELWMDGDSRKYLIERQRSEAEHRRRGRQPLQRVKTDRLPLETVPEMQGTQHLVLHVEIDMMKLADRLGDMVGSDGFCNNYRTDIESSEQMDLDDVVEVEVRLKDLLSTWTEKLLGEKTEVDLNLRSQVKGKMVAV